jgi:segregation and condensation protein A
VAQLLRATWQGDDIFFRQPQTLPQEEYQGRHRKKELLDAYLSAIGKRQAAKPSQRVFEPLVARRMVSVSSRITIIMNRLYQQPKLPFLSLFDEQQDRAEIVATFLAVLELVKNKRVFISDDGATVLMNESYEVE